MSAVLLNPSAMKYRLMVVENEINFRNQITDFFTQRQYDVTVAADIENALRLNMLTKFDCVVIGMTAPRINSVNFIQQIRQRSSVPVVIISARRDEYEKIHALQMGADGYLFKPTNLLQLDARIVAILRRIGMTRLSMRTPFLQLDASTRSVVVNGQTIEVTPMEFGIITTVMASPGRVFSRKELTALMFGEQFSIGRAIDVHISNIRNKIERNPNKPIYIVTVYGKGYMYQDPTELSE